MKKRLLLLLLVLFSLTNTALAQKFVWAKGGHNVHNSSGSVLDSHGNNYLATDILDSASFDTASVYTPYLSGGICITKYRPDGKLAAIFTVIGASDAQIERICIDKSDNIYLHGRCMGNLILGPHTIHGPTTVFTEFVAKMDTSGNFIWAKDLGDPTISTMSVWYTSEIFDITCDKAGYLYITGFPGAPNYHLDTLIINDTGGSIFFAKLDPANGTAIWARQIYQVHQSGFAGFLNFPDQIITDSNSNVYVVGNFELCDIHFNYTDTLYSTGQNIFLAKYDQSGNYQWARRVDTSGGGWARATIDFNNNIYLFGSSNGFYTKYREDGTRFWYKALDFNGGNMCNFMNGNFTNIYFRDSFHYGSFTYRLPGDHGMVIKTDTGNGNLIWNTSACEIFGSTLSSGKHGAIQLSGSTINNSPFTAFDGNLLKECRAFVTIIYDSTFAPPFNNAISGNIFNDNNGNCTLNSEPGLKGFGVIAEPGPYFAVADSQGNYSLKVDTGLYSVREIIPTGDFFTDTITCSGGTIIKHCSGTGTVDTGDNFPNRYSVCPLLDVTASTGSWYDTCDVLHFISISIRNFGLDTARNVILKVRYPGYIVTPLYSSITWSSYSTIDSTVTFMLGDLPPDSNLHLTITDTVNCFYINSFIAALCDFKIHVTPNNSCYPADSEFNYKFLPIGFYIPEGVKNAAADDNELKIFPNPSSSKVNVTNLKPSSTIELMDLFGQKIISITDCQSNEKELDISNFPAGTYFIKVTSKCYPKTFKIIKM